MSTSANRVIQLKDRLPSNVSGQITGSLSRIAGQLTDVAQDWSTKAKSAARNTDSYVRSSPWQAVGIVALVGLAAGILGSRQARQTRQRRKVAQDQQDLTGG